MQNVARFRPFLPTLPLSVITTQTFFVVVIQVISLYLFCGGNKSQEYATGDHIPLWLDTVGPVNNPHERYPFTSLPYCYPGLSTVRKESENDCGPRLSGHSIGFQTNSTYRCTTHPLQYKDLVAYYKLIGGGSRHRNSTFRIYLANIPMYGMIGSEQHNTQETGSSSFVSGHANKVSFLLYTRHHLKINSDKTRILDTYLESDTSSLVELRENRTFTLELVVEYHQSDKTDRREDSRVRSKRLLGEDWKYSVGMSSFVLFTLIWFSTRTSIWARESKIQANQIVARLEKDQTDVITTKSETVNEPRHLSLLAAMTGAGCQLFFVAIVIGYKTWIRGNGFIIRGEVIDTFWTSVALTSFIGSYTLTRIIRKHREPRMLGLFDDGMNLFQRELKLEELSDGPVMDTEESINKAVVFANKKHLLHGIIKESLCIYWCIFHGFHMTIQLILLTVDWWRLKMEPNICSQTRTLVKTIHSIGPKVALAIVFGVVGSFIGLKGRVKTTSKVNVWPQIHLQLSKFRLLQKTLHAVIVCGFLAFVSLSFELHALMSSAWSFRPYEVTSSAFIVITISIVIMTLATRITLWVGFVSGKFDWQWMALGCGMSMSLYFIIASAYFCFLSSWMTGWYQRSYFWLVTVCIALDVGLMYGAVGFWSGYSFAISPSRQKSY